MVVDRDDDECEDLARTLGRDVAADVLGHVTPVGQQADWAARAFAAIDPYLPAPGGRAGG
ncbi:MAG TPA: hypothetical protein VFT22_24175 [Kofleriaceae bacterium]|nr:hypothetical protein [Kofleriaceae bacterium]